MFGLGLMESFSKAMKLVKTSGGCLSCVGGMCVSCVHIYRATFAGSGQYVASRLFRVATRRGADFSDSRIEHEVLPKKALRPAVVSSLNAWAACCC